MSLGQITERLRAAEDRAGRAAGSVRLLAVSKKQPPERVEAVLDEGHRLFGENRVQEAAERWSRFGPRFADVELHLVGPLQSNKAREAITLFSAIHSLDRPRLARTLARLAREEGRCPDLFVQVNTGGEAQKSGVTPGGADALIAECRDLDLPVTGLMCLPPLGVDPRPHFRLLAEIASRNALPELSIGMSDDFEVAVEEGATVVRIGSAVFGPRPSS